MHFGSAAAQTRVNPVSLPFPLGKPMGSLQSVSECCERAGISAGITYSRVSRMALSGVAAVPRS